MRGDMFHPLDGLDLTEIYETRKWKIYEVEIGSAEYDGICNLVGSEKEMGLRVCGASSPVALDWFDERNSVEGLFFYDTEQESMGLGAVYGVMDYGRLTEAWRGHPVGAIVMMVAKGVEDHKFTVCVEEVKE